MLEGNFYHIISANSSSDFQVQYSIRFDPDHAIFKGHFPGNPVVPGVCMIQIIQELLSLKLEQSILLRKASVIKFLHVMDPGKHAKVNVEIDFNIEEENIITSANFANEQITFMKFKGVFSLNS